MGNVLVSYNPREDVKQFFEDEQDVEILMKDMFGSLEWREMDRGTISREQAMFKIMEKLPLHLKNFVLEEAINKNWTKHMKPFSEMYDLVAKLKQNGYKIYLLSNASSDFYEFSKAYPVMDLMDGKVISADYLVIKPEKEIYEILFNKFSLEPSESFFIDDMQQNVDTAKSLGMDGACFSPSFEPVENLCCIMRKKSIMI